MSRLGILAIFTMDPSIMNQVFRSAARLVVCILVASIHIHVGSRSFADHSEFYESFDGNGPFPSLERTLTGFDNDAGLILGDQGDDQHFPSPPYFTDGGLRFENYGQNTQGDTDFDRISRAVFKPGNFVETIVIKDIDTGCCEWGEWAFTRKISEELSINAGIDSILGLGVFYNDSDYPPLVEFFEPSTYSELKIVLEFREPNFTIEFNDGADGLWGPFEFPFAPDREQTTQLQATGLIAGRGDGTIVEWSLVRLFGNGDFDDSGSLDGPDIDILSLTIAQNTNDQRYDLDYDGFIDSNDRQIWVHRLANTFFGDANLDGEFNSSDLVSVFQASEYEDELELHSTWATGDWNGDGDFTSRDLVFAFGDGGYEVGHRVTAPHVPEPSSVALLSIASLMLTRIARETVA